MPGQRVHAAAGDKEEEGDRAVSNRHDAVITIMVRMVWPQNDTGGGSDKQVFHVHSGLIATPRSSTAAIQQSIAEATGMVEKQGMKMIRETGMSLWRGVRPPDLPKQTTYRAIILYSSSFIAISSCGLLHRGCRIRRAGGNELCVGEIFLLSLHTKAHIVLDGLFGDSYNLYIIVPRVIIPCCWLAGWLPSR